MPAGGASFKAEINGFRITSGNFTRVPEGLMLAEAYIENFPRALGGGRRVVVNLGIRTEDMTVFQSGVSPEPFTVTPPYGLPVSMGRLSFESGGLFADDVSVPLPKSAGGGKMTFQRLPLDPKGSPVPCAPLTDPGALSLSGYAAQGGEAVFDGTAVRVKSLRVSIPQKDASLDLRFTDLVITGRGVKTAGTHAGDVPCSRDGWSLTLKNPAFDGARVTAGVEVALPESFDSYTIEFPRAVFFPDGSLSTEPVQEGAFTRIHGWQVMLEGARLSGDTISCPRAVLQLHAIMGGAEILIPDVALRSDGTLASCGVSQKRVEFVSTSGFWVAADRFWFNDENLVMKARVFFPEALGKDIAASYEEVPLRYDGVIVTPPRADPLTYDMAGWKVRAEGYWFDGDGLHVPHSYLTIPAKEPAVIDIPDFLFYADGSIHEGGEQVLASFVLFLSSTRLGVSGLVFDEKGLSGRCFADVLLDSGQGTFYWEKVRFHPDGTFESDSFCRNGYISMGGFQADFENITLSQDGLDAVDCAFTLPKKLGGGRFTTMNLLIDFDGLVRPGFGSNAMGGFTYKEFQVRIESMKISGSSVDLSGTITIPQTFPGEHAGETLKLNSFRFSGDGDVLGWSITPEVDVKL